MTFENSNTSGSNLQSRIDAALGVGAGGGWTKTGSGFPYTYSNASATGQDRLVSFQLNALAANYLQFTAIGPLGNKTFYLYTGGQSLTGSYAFAVSGGPNHFFMAIEGPDLSAGAGITEDPTYGSSRSFFGMFPIVPYFATDTVKNNLVVAFAGTSNAGKSFSTEKVYVARGLDNTSWAPAELLTVGPAVVGVNAVGAQVQRRDAQNNLTPYWPFLINEDASGLRGRIDGLYYAGENYTLSPGDSGGLAYSEGLNATIDGAVHTVISPFYLPNTSGQYCPLGVPTPNTTQAANVTNGGPLVAVKN